MYPQGAHKPDRYGGFYEKEVEVETTCPKCGELSTDWYTVQSGYCEIFCECNECGETWDTYYDQEDYR
jgi:DNA-directed RNA polymerase subunit M/transcription elongation factor TFIIS